MIKLLRRAQHIGPRFKVFTRDGLKQVEREFDNGTTWTGGREPQSGPARRTTTELDTPLTPPNILHAESATEASDLGEIWDGRIEFAVKAAVNVALNERAYQDQVLRRVKRARDALARGQVRIADEILGQALGSREDLMRQAANGVGFETKPDGSLGAPNTPTGDSRPAYTGNPQANRIGDRPRAAATPAQINSANAKFHQQRQDGTRGATADSAQRNSRVLETIAKGAQRLFGPAAQKKAVGR